MTTREKLARMIEESPLNQSNFGRAAGIGHNKVSEMLNNKAGTTLNYIKAIAAYTNTSLDWWYNDDLSWPPIYLGERGAFLSEAEKKVLERAHEVSGGDETLGIALRRLLRLADEAPMSEGTGRRFLTPDAPASGNPGGAGATSNGTKPKKNGRKSG